MPTKIEWTDESWNPVRGCSRVSEGCRNCYAEGVAARFSGGGMPYEGLITRTTKGPTWNGEIKLVPTKLGQPLRWTRSRMIFVNSMSDLFHPAVPDEFIDEVFAVMALAPQHTFQVLTKRPERMREYLSRPAVQVRIGLRVLAMCLDSAVATKGRSELGRGVTLKATDINPGGLATWPLPNVWLGVSVEDQAAADERIPLLLQTPAAVRWISAEPLLGPVDITKLPSASGIGRYLNATSNAGVDPGALIPAKVDWVIVGGESGPNARPMHPDWVRVLRHQCAEAGVPFLFKQWGEWSPEYNEDADMGEYHSGTDWVDGCMCSEGDGPLFRIGKKAAGRLLDGIQHDGYPSVSGGR